MNPELELFTDEEREEQEAAFRELCADEFDALYMLEAAHAQEAMMDYGSEEMPW